VQVRQLIAVNATNATYEADEHADQLTSTACIQSDILLSIHQQSRSTQKRAQPRNA
jgi:hypothetical protein